MGRVGTPRYKNEVGNVYSKLTVVEFSHTDKQSSFWKCKCECGRETVAKGSALRCGHRKSCGECDIQKPMNELAAYKKHYGVTKQGAKMRKLEFVLSFDEFMVITKQPCAYCGKSDCDSYRALSRRGVDSDIISTGNGVDRIDSAKGYVPGNMVSCCNMCNRMKSNFGVDEFLDKVKEIYEHRTQAGNNSGN